MSERKSLNSEVPFEPLLGAKESPKAVKTRYSDYRDCVQLLENITNVRCRVTNSEIVT